MRAIALRDLKGGQMPLFGFHRCDLLVEIRDLRSRTTAAKFSTSLAALPFNAFYMNLIDMHAPETLFCLLSCNLQTCLTGRERHFGSFQKCLKNSQTKCMQLVSVLP